MKNKKRHLFVNHRLTFVIKYRQKSCEVCTLNIVIFGGIHKNKIHLSKRKIYPNRKRELLDAWKRIEWKYDEL